MMNLNIPAVMEFKEIQLLMETTLVMCCLGKNSGLERKKNIKKQKAL